jgi:outer membrane receptor protein involved in Fe transport
VNLLDKKRGFWAAVMLRCRAAHLLPAGSIALVTLLTAGSASAQGTAVLTGTIVDAATKKPLADVVVTVTSPALQGEQTVVTDGSGSYRVPNLPQGDYTLRLDKDAFRPYARGGITMRGNSTIRVNAELLPESVQLKAEEVVVVGKAPTVDVGSSSTGVTLNQDFTSRIALNAPGGKGAASHSFESLAAVAPGASADTYGVGINGTTSPENAFQIDGVGVNDGAYGILATPLSTEFIKELNVVSGGYMPEYGRAMGGIFDVSTKTGSNEFHGSVWFNFSPGSLEGPRTPLKSDASVITTNSRISNLRDFGADIGGPIVKDKLWFYGGLQAAFTREALDRTLNAFVLDPATGAPTVDAEGSNITTPIPGGNRTFYADEQAIQYIGKLTYLLNQDHHLTLSVIGTPTTSGGNGAFGYDNTGTPEISNIVGAYGTLAHKYVASSSDVSLKYQGSFNNKKQLLDITFGWHHQRTATLAADGSNIGDTTGLASIPEVIYRRTATSSPGQQASRHALSDFEAIGNAKVCDPITLQVANPKFDPTQPESDKNPKQVPNVFTPCPVSSYAQGGSGYLDDASINSYQGRAVFTNLIQAAGHHVIKAGVDFNVSSYQHQKAYSGGNVFREAGSGNNYNDYRQYGFLQGPDDPVVLTSYTAKSTSTTIGGFIQDSWSIMDKVTLNVGVRYDTQLIYGSDGALGLSLPNQWSPRIGVIYDPTQQGRAKIFANYARYYEGVPLDIADRGFPGEPQMNSFHNALTPKQPTGCDPFANPTSDACTKDVNRLGQGAPNNPNQLWNRTGGDRVPIDPDVSPQSSDEFVVGGEYEIFSDARVGLTYTHRYLNRAIEDMSRDEANTYFIGNPGYGISADFPKAVRDYDAVTAFFQKNFSNNWLANVSYTVSALRGNYAGLFRPETGQLDPNANSDFDLKSLLPNRTGPLPADQTHSIKVYAAKDFVIPGGMDLLVGGTFRTHSGTPLNFLASHPLYGADEIFILPRGAGGRNDWIHNVDLRLGYSIRLSKESTASITMDIFNIFNFQGVTSRDQTFTTTDAAPIVNKDGSAPTVKDLNDPTKFTHTDGTPVPASERNTNFGNPTSYQDPRQFRFGAKVSF